MNDAKKAIKKKIESDLSRAGSLLGTLCFGSDKQVARIGKAAAKEAEGRGFFNFLGDDDDEDEAENEKDRAAIVVRGDEEK